MGKEKGLITKGRYELKFRGTECLNCGHILDVSDKYCPNCGQANSTKKLVLKDFFDEFFSSLINYDSKLLKTLYTLLVKPGTITKDYIRGKRIAYTNPFRFLLSLAFLYFLMVSYSDSFSNLDNLKLDEKIEQTGPMSFSLNTRDSEENDSTARKATVYKDADGLLKALDTLKKNEPNIARTFMDVDSLQSMIQEGIDQERKSDSLMLANPKTFFKDLQNDTDSNNFFGKMEFFTEMLRKDSIVNFEDAEQKYDVKASTGNKMSFNASKSMLKVISQPGTWINDTIAKLPFVIFFFLPIFTIFIFVVYIRKKYTYTDHLIFSFHNQSLFFILLILSWIIDTLFGTASAGLFLLVFAIYLYKAMRRFYGQGRFKTIVKYIFLNSMFTFLALITIVLLFTGSVFTY